MPTCPDVDAVDAIPNNLHYYVVKHTFSLPKARKPHYLHAFMNIAQPVTKHNYLHYFVTPRQKTKKTLYFLTPAP